MYYKHLEAICFKRLGCRDI